MNREMRTRDFRVTALTLVGMAIVLCVTLPGRAADAKTPYPSMAPLEQYLSASRDAEIALARSAAPDSISRDAEIVVLTSHGYETASKGTNGFVCVVMRAWVMETNNPEFWNPKLRAPICVNAAAAPSYIPPILKKTEMILGGKSKEEMAETIKAGLDSKEFPAPAPGAMSYMMSKQQYLNDEGQHWHPHVMFFSSPTDEKTWGANLAGSPMLADMDHLDRMTVFMITVANWSDGTPDSERGH